MERYYHAIKRKRNISQLAIDVIKKRKLGGYSFIDVETNKCLSIKQTEKFISQPTLF